MCACGCEYGGWVPVTIYELAYHDLELAHHKCVDFYLLQRFECDAHALCLALVLGSTAYDSSNTREAIIQKHLEPCWHVPRALWHLKRPAPLLVLRNAGSTALHTYTGTQKQALVCNLLTCASSKKCLICSLWADSSKEVGRVCELGSKAALYSCIRVTRCILLRVHSINGALH